MRVLASRARSFLLTALLRVCARGWLVWLDRTAASVLNMSRRKRLSQMTPAEREAHVRKSHAEFVRLAPPEPTDEQCE